MIPFASQRSNGQDLAVHLMNEHDNDSVSLVSLRGSVAKDLSGAFAEWEVQAHTLTNCKKYLYSLSVNPDKNQSPMSQELYLEYLDRVEEELGLSEQPRAVVRHVKEGREHYHAIYSRIDPWVGKAVQISHDKIKLMEVTRGFAADHDLELPKGYHDHARRQKRRQMSLYENAQTNSTGISRAEHIGIISDIWQRRDSARAFVIELQNKGYYLASGRRPYLLVDSYGNINSLVRLIDDRTVKTKDVRNFLEAEFPSSDLPDAEALKQALKEKYRQDTVLVDLSPSDEKLIKLEAMQRRRREEAEQKLENVRAKKRIAFEQEKTVSRARLSGMRSALLHELRNGRRINRAETSNRRMRARSNFKKDRRALQDYLSEKQEIREQLNVNLEKISRIFDLKLLELRRGESARDALEKREHKALMESVRRARLYRNNARYDQSPGFALTLSPPGRMPNYHRAQHRFLHHEESDDKRKEKVSDTFNDLTENDSFDRVAKSEQAKEEARSEERSRRF